MSLIWTFSATGKKERARDRIEERKKERKKDRKKERKSVESQQSDESLI